ncbi:MAG: hypothetical protein HZC28_13270 [Spirochaetes bacterium]|nr:hypothetical protein [Spirochaetota bacterium]
MKRFLSKVACASLAAVLAMTIGCSKNPFENTSEASEKTGVEVTIGGSGAQVSGVPSAMGIVPSEADIVSGTVTITSVATGESVSKSAPYGEKVKFTKLLPGEYTVNVKLFDAQGKSIYEGTSNADVAEGVTLPVTVLVTPQGGSVTVGLLIGKLILWNTLDSAYALANSVEGPAGSFIGNASNYSFAAGKYDNGLQAVGQFDCANKVVFPGSVVATAKGSIEFWYKKTGAWQAGAGADLFCQGVPGSPTQNMEGCISTGYSGHYELRFGYAGTHLYTGFYNSNFTSNQNYHLAFVWDEAGIGGSSDKIRVYVDGVLVGSTNYTVARNVATNQPFVVGDIHAASGWTEWCAQGVIDNLKIFNYAKTDFSDRVQE